jgi:hypothetical protein
LSLNSSVFWVVKRRWLRTDVSGLPIGPIYKGKVSSIFTRWGRVTQAKLPTWRTWVSHLVRVITFDFSDVVGLSSGYSTAGTAVRIP